MPELNNDAPDAEVLDVTWPELAVSGGGQTEITDPAVRAILDQVRGVPGLPVSEHPEAYAGMHDALLEALNEEPQHQEPQHQEPQHQEPQHQEPQHTGAD